MSQSRIILQTTAQKAAQAAGFLETFFEEEGYPIARFPLHTEGEPQNAADWQVELYMPTQAVDEVLACWRKQPLLAFSKDALSVERLEDKNWIAASLAELRPVRAGRFFAYGRHDEDKLPAGAIPIRIEANLAFGTGHHGTTLGCLLALDRLIKHQRFNRALDLGTGSGILAIALAKALKKQVIASDSDPVAVKIASENARSNQAGHFVRTVEAVGLRHPLLRKNAPYDLIVANILAGPLIALAGEITAHLKAGGTLVLSGILASQAGRVAGAYTARGFAMAGRSLLEGWTTLILKKR